jgi:hypothetical protein
VVIKTKNRKRIRKELPKNLRKRTKESRRGEHNSLSDSFDLDVWREIEMKNKFKFYSLRLILLTTFGGINKKQKRKKRKIIKKSHKITKLCRKTKACKKYKKSGKRSRKRRKTTKRTKK